MYVYDIITYLDIYGYSYHLFNGKGGVMGMHIFQEGRIVELTWSQADAPSVQLYVKEAISRNSKSTDLLHASDHLFDCLNELHLNEIPHYLVRMFDQGVCIVAAPTDDVKMMINYSSEGKNEESLFVKKPCSIQKSDELFSLLKERPTEWGSSHMRPIYEHTIKEATSPSRVMEHQESTPPMPLNHTPIRNLFDLLRYLDKLHIWHDVAHYSLDTITLLITIAPGERIEVDCESSGEMTIARFLGEEVTDMTIDDLTQKIGQELGYPT